MKRGFTLIEIIVVMGVVGLLMTATVYVLSGTFQGKARVEVADEVERNGTLILDELRKIGLNSFGSGIVCPAMGVGESVSMTSARDGGVTVLSCVEGDEVASSSASGRVNLLASGVVVSGCDSFVSCETMPNMAVSAVNYNFRLSMGSSGFGGGLVERDFRSKVVIRN